MDSKAAKQYDTVGLRTLIRVFSSVFLMERW